MKLHSIAISILATLSTFTISAGEPTKYQLKINNFTELKVVDDVNVIYKCHPDSACTAVFMATPEQASSLIFQPDGTKLEIQIASDAVPTTTGLPVVTVYSSFLNRAENDGKAHLIVESPAPGPKFKCVLVGNGRLTARNLQFTTVEVSLMTGNGEMVVSGKTDIAKISSTGTGQIQADELVAKDVKCRLVGTGSVGVNATETITVSGMGSGTVYYIGEPSVKNRTLGVKTEKLKPTK